MNAAPQRRMTAQEFLEWADRQTEGRYELDDGQIVAKAPERVAHARTKGAVWLALSTALKEAALPCEAFPDGVAIITGDYRTREPDASVQCGGVADPDSLALDRPLIVVEVVSPTSTRTDRQQKRDEYFSVATIRHYLIVDAAEAVVIHYRRSEAGTIEAATHRSGRIELDPPGFGVAVEDLFGRG